MKLVSAGLRLCSNYSSLQMLEADRCARDGGKGSRPDLEEARPHPQRLGLVVQADAAPVMPGHGTPHIVFRIQHQESILQFADFLAQAIPIHLRHMHIEDGEIELG